MPKLPYLLAVATLLSQAAAITAALAQGNDSSTSAAQGRRGETGQESGSGGKGPVAHVGAGTTNGSTTGVSGPTGNGSAPPGEVQLPPLPNPSLCDAYRGMPAYRGCLWVVLRQGGQPQ